MGKTWRSELRSPFEFMGKPWFFITMEPKKCLKKISDIRKDKLIFNNYKSFKYFSLMKNA